MPRLLLAALLTIPLALSGTVAAQTVPEGCRVFSGEDEAARLVCTERTYFKCVGDVKVQNAAILQGQVPSWNTTPPAASFRSGAGCGTADTLLTNTSNPRNGHDGVWEGTFTGNLDSMTLEFHQIDTTSRLDNVINLLLWVQVGGQDVVTRTTTTTIEVPGQRSDSGLSIKYVVSITDIGFVPDVGRGSVEHEVMVSARAFADYPGAWVWDATEIPAGVTFNPATLAPHRLRSATAAA